VLSSWLSACCFRTWRTVREEGADSLRGAFGLSVLRVLRVFLSAFVSIRLASGFWWKVVWRTVRMDVADRPRTWYGPSACGGASWVVLLVINEPSAVWCGPSAWWSRTVRPRAADCPPGLLQNS
jgi:hypothetical protein